MAEPTVQVPVSLIESWERRFRNVADMPGTADELRALLSQPTPTAEPCTCPPPATHLGEGPDQDCPKHGNRIRATAPPSIADMVPGTTFEQVIKWTVRRTAIGAPYVENDTDALPGHSIDPSTIRDVTPPADAS